MAQLSFKGKAFVDNYHLTVPYHPLFPQPKKSVLGKGKDAAPSLHDNVVIHGDNLKALKALLPTHAGKVKCIYIDPPYNTGNEHWVYNDKVNSPMMAEWLGKDVGRDDLTRHDKWLCMMTPRLKLLRELLREDGVIFISIDDNEVHHLRMLMDEIFGEENFVMNLIRKIKTSNNKSIDGTNTQHEYTLCYGKDKASIRLRGGEKSFENYSNPDNDPNGEWIADNPTANLDGRKKKNVFPITNPYTSSVDVPPRGRHWNFSEDDLPNLIASGTLLFKRKHRENERGFVLKRYKKNILSNFHTFDSLHFVGNDFINEVATRDLYELFENKVFEYTKPVTLIEHLVRFTTDDGDIILDSFAGSGTTAHAVLALNKADGGNRKFILVECEDYADKITAERVRRVIKGVPSAKDEALKQGLGGTFSYFELGEHPIDAEHLLSGKSLPAWRELARFAFYTATGESYDAKSSKEKDWHVGTSKEYDVFLVYKPDVAFLKSTALDTTRADAIAKLGRKGKKKLVFAPMKYVSDEYLKERGIVFAQLPFELYR